LAEKDKRYSLCVFGIFSTQRHDSNILEKGDGWKLFYYGVEFTMSAHAGMGRLVSP